MKTNNSEKRELVGNPVRDWRAIFFGAFTLLVLLIGNSIRMYLLVIERGSLVDSSKDSILSIDTARLERFEKYREDRKARFELIIDAR